jgi:hypothetical protein
MNKINDLFLFFDIIILILITNRLYILHSLHLLHETYIIYTSISKKESSIVIIMLIILNKF